jgi:hypothetical protein
MGSILDFEMIDGSKVIKKMDLKGISIDHIPPSKENEKFDCCLGCEIAQIILESADAYGFYEKMESKDFSGYICVRTTTSDRIHCIPISAFVGVLNKECPQIDAEKVLQLFVDNKLYTGTSINYLNNMPFVGTGSVGEVMFVCSHTFYILNWIKQYINDMIKVRL